MCVTSCETVSEVAAGERFGFSPDPMESNPVGQDAPHRLHAPRQRLPTDIIAQLAEMRMMMESQQREIMGLKSTVGIAPRPFQLVGDASSIHVNSGAMVLAPQHHSEAPSVGDRINQVHIDSSPLQTHTERDALALRISDTHFGSAQVKYATTIPQPPPPSYS